MPLQFEPKGLDIQPQPDFIPPPLPPLQFAPMSENDPNLTELSRMGTQRALERLLNRKKPAVDARKAWEAGGSL